jgi:hypothetical protein
LRRNGLNSLEPEIPPLPDDNGTNYYGGTNEWQSGGTGQGIPHGPDVLSLDILSVTLSNATAQLAIHPPTNVNNGVYDLFSTTNIEPSGWNWVQRCDPGQTNLTVTNLPGPRQFFILGLTNDTDRGGGSDAWELLVSHGDPTDPADDRPMPPGMSVAILDSQLTRNHWSSTNWNYFVMPESVKEALRSDGTPFTVVGDTTIAKGRLLTNDEPRYPILISLAAESIGDDEIGPLTNYVAAGGFLLVGSSSFTRNAADGLRSDFALADQMGLHCEPGPTNWLGTTNFTKQADHRLVSHIPAGLLTWRMPTSSEEISWGTCLDGHKYAGPHQIWAVSNDSSALVLATAEDVSSPYLVVKPYGKGCFIFHAAMQPLIGHGGFAPGMYAYVIFRRAIEWAFESALRPVAKLSPWPYQYDAAFMVRHDLETFTDEVADVDRSAQYEAARGAKGDYYFCTGAITNASNFTAILAGLSAAISHGATIGPHNGGKVNPYDTCYDPTLYWHWHWGPDEALDMDPPGTGKTYALDSMSLSFDQIDTWLGTQSPRLWVAPCFNATREDSYRIQEQLGVRICGEQKLTPFPHWTLSTQTDGKRYAFLSEPVSDWFVNGYVAQSLEPWHEGVHTKQTMHDGVDFYYGLGALINFYSHALSDTILTNPPSTVKDLVQDYILYCTNHPNMWAANARDVYDWWLKRSAAQIRASYAVNGDTNIATLAVTGAQDPTTAVEFLVPYAALATNLQVFTNSTRATAGYRTNTTASGLAIRVRVGTTVTNVQCQYVLRPAAQNDTYSMTQGGVLTNNVLANDWPGTWPGLTATKVSDPSHGTLTHNSDETFTYTPQTGFFGTDCFTYEAAAGGARYGQATVSIFVAKTNALFNDDFTRCPAPYSLGSWRVASAYQVSGAWNIADEPPANTVMQGTSALGYYGYAYVNADWTNSDYSVEARIKFPAGGYGGGLGGRLNPQTGAHYAAWIYPEGSSSFLGEKTLALIKFFQWNSWGYGSNSFVPMTNTTLPSVGTDWHTLKLAFSNNLVQVFYHGTNILSMYDTETNHVSNSSGGVSLDMWTSDFGPSFNMSVDDVIVAPYP